MKIFIFKLKYTVLVACLSGCLATTDLSTSGTLPPLDTAVAQAIADRVPRRCRITTFDPQSGRRVGGEIEIVQRVQIPKLLKSESGWYKAEARSQGVWSNIYYNPKIDQMICGDNSWAEYYNSNTVTFFEINPTGRPLPGIKTYDEDYSSQSNPVDEKRSIGLLWEGYPKMITGSVFISSNGSAGNISLILPNKDGQCTGKYNNFIKSSPGSWTIVCTNGMAAKGLMTYNEKRKFITGNGDDNLKRKVQFTIESN